MLTKMEDTDTAGLSERRQMLTVTSRANPIPIFLRPAMKESYVQFYIEQQWWRDRHDARTR